MALKRRRRTVGGRGIRVMRWFAWYCWAEEKVQMRGATRVGGESAVMFKLEGESVDGYKPTSLSRGPSTNIHVR